MKSKGTVRTLHVRRPRHHRHLRQAGLRGPAAGSLAPAARSRSSDVTAAALRRAQPARAAGLRCARRTRPDSRNPTTNRRTRPTSARLDFKLNLLLDLAGQLLAASQPRAAARHRSASTPWARACSTTKPLAAGAHGILEVMLARHRRAAAATCRRKSCRARRAGQTRVRFLSLGETVADHIEKLVFRRHRRKIAGARQHSRARKIFNDGFSLGNFH